MFQQTNIDEEVDAQLEKSSRLSCANNQQQNLAFTAANLTQQKINNNNEKSEARYFYLKIL